MSRCRSPRVIRTHTAKGRTKTSRQASGVSRRTTPPDQIPHAHPTSIPGQDSGVIQIRGPTPPAIPGSPQVPNHQLTPPVEHIQPGHEPQPPATADASEAVQESHERLVERVREVVPDVLPAHVFKLLSTHEDTFADNPLDVVIHILLEDRSYPKDLKGKAKARAAEKETEESPGDIDTNMDYTLLDANRHLGSVYRNLSWVCFDFPFFCTNC
jgi:TRIAD3 protein (E3 ubiquitin-protein ligase RNF216)